MELFDTRKTAQRWTSTLLVIFSTTVAFTIWAAGFPLLTLWVRDLGISHAQGGLLGGLFYVPAFFVALPSGWLLDRYSSRIILGPSWACIVLGTLLMSLASSFFVLCVGRLIFSIGMWVHQVGAPKLLGDWFAGRKELGFVMALYTWSFTIGVFISLTFVGRIAVSIGWRQALSLLAALGGTALLVMLVVPSDGLTSLAAQTSHADFRPFRFGLLLWFAAFAYLFYNSGSDSYYTFTPDYLVKRGYDLAHASSFVGWYAWVAFVLKPLCSIFLNRKTAPLFIVAGSACAIVAFGLLLLPTLWPLVITVLIGASLALCMPSLIALPAFLLPRHLTGKGYGFVQMLGSLELFAQPVIGYSIDRTGNHQWAYAIMSLYCFLALLAASLISIFDGRAKTVGDEFDLSLIKAQVED